MPRELADDRLADRREVATYCRLCEATCGLIATVENGRLTKVRGNRRHVLSQGFICTKAQAAVEVMYDPDRVVFPLRREGEPGVFRRCSWDDALNDIAQRLERIKHDHGSESIASLLGNPPYTGYACALFYPGFQDALGIKYRYSINGDDAASRMAASAVLYGSPANILVPDLWQTSFAIVVGANPLVSKGSMVSEPLFREALDSIRDRGGRVVVIDPRRTETARRYEHVSLIPGTDAWLLAGISRVILDEGLEDRAFLNEHTVGLDELRDALASFDPQRCSERCGVPAETIRALARDFAAAPSALVYGRTGTCTQRFGTLNNVLQDTACVLTGNIDRKGGLLFGWGAIDFYGGNALPPTYNSFQSRVQKLPEIVGILPASALAADIEEPGDGQIRALVNVGCNAVITTGAGGGKRLEGALEKLDLHVSLDLYINETNKYADYILPVTSMYERNDFPMFVVDRMLRPAAWATPAVVEPRDEAREEWEILDELARHMGLGGAQPAPELREAARGGVVTTPEQILNGMLAQGPCQLSFEELRDGHPDGIMLRADVPRGRIRERVPYPDGKIRLNDREILAEFQSATTHRDDPAFPLRLIGMREVQSQNSWMHNVPRLMPAGRQFAARVHPVDASAAGIQSGEVAEIMSPTGSIETRVIVSDEVRPGTIAVPHGWGHDGGWRRANAAGGVNSNDLTSQRLEDIERLAGMSILNGIPVRLSAVPVG